MIVAAGSKESLKQMVRRQKRGNAPKNPPTIEDIPKPFPVEYAGIKIYDNEQQDKRIIIFATEDGLRLLGAADTWFMDGTHSTAPKQFEQLFVIRVPLGDTCVSAVYALLPSKETYIYEEMFNHILDACGRLHITPKPVRVIADYEMAIHNAVRSSLNRQMDIQGHAFII